MKYLSLFSGIGGFELGIQQAYEDLQKLRIKDKRQSKGAPIGNTKGRSKQLPKLGVEGLSCIGYSEIDKYATQIYQQHFPEHKNYGDITKIKAEDLPEFDLIVGGFPCQAFSIAGKRGGFNDTRGTLFFEIARIIKAKQPRLLLLENVKGLLSHDEGRTFATIISTLDELGYDIQWQVLNSKNFGVPQNRERVFIVGHLRGTPRPQVFPFGEQTETVDRAIFIDESQWRREGKLREYEGTCPTLNTVGGGGHLPLTANIQKGKEVVGEDYHDSQNGGNAPTSGVSESSNLSLPTIRRLTPTECERLQGFPDGWTKGLSDTQRYKCLGNAVTVNVIQAIMERLLK